MLQQQQQQLGSVTLLSSQSSSCLLSLILMAEEPIGNTQNSTIEGLIHVCGCLFVMQELKSGVHEEPKCHELVTDLIWFNALIWACFLFYWSLVRIRGIKCLLWYGFFKSLKSAWKKAFFRMWRRSLATGSLYFFSHFRQDKHRRGPVNMEKGANTGSGWSFKDGWRYVCIHLFSPSHI